MSWNKQMRLLLRSWYTAARRRRISSTEFWTRLGHRLLWDRRLSDLHRTSWRCGATHSTTLINNSWGMKRWLWILPLLHVLWQVALLVLRVVDLSELASVLPGSDPVQTDVELLAIGRVRVTGMGLRIAIGVQLLLFGASETVVQSYWYSKRDWVLILWWMDGLIDWKCRWSPSSRTHPSRLALSGQAQTPVGSSKTKLAGHVLKRASPSMQLTNWWQLVSSGCWKKPLRRRQFSVGWGSSAKPSTNQQINIRIDK